VVGSLRACADRTHRLLPMFPRLRRSGTSALGVLASPASSR
jgi:uncharacterized protein (DUF1810 family)